MLAEATRLGQDLPFLTLLREVVEAGERHGEGGRDNSITIEESRRRKTAGAGKKKTGAAGGQ